MLGAEKCPPHNFLKKQTKHSPVMKFGDSSYVGGALGLTNIMIGSLLCWHNASLIGKFFESIE